MRAAVAAGVFAVFMGVAMFGMWSMFIVTDQIPEFEDEAVRISFHLAGEFLTAAALLVSGIAMIKGKDWAFTAFLVAMGMLTYTLVVSPGYYGQQGDYAFVAMFLAFLAATVVLTLYALRNEDDMRAPHRKDS
jgi:peptidoglycan/LPS O-acetylase OafA/YrhL